MVLKVADFKLSRSMRKTLRRFISDDRCELRIDAAFRSVIEACAQTARRGQSGTWITTRLMQAYCDWHRLGAVHSFETWMGGELVGGLYGVGIGSMFFGESMFSRCTDASKIALAGLVAFCRWHGIEWIDCQQNTSHLASLGAAEVPRDAFLRHLDRAARCPQPASWTYHEAYWDRLVPGAAEPGEPFAKVRID